MKNRIHFLMLIVATVATDCGNEDGGFVLLSYSPPIYFAGYINGDYDSLTGNYWYRNSCELVKDTIRMNFYSSNFEEVNNVRHGDFIRIDLYPGKDSLAIGRGRILFHMARYHERNVSYNISPVDTVYGTDRIQVYIDKLVWKRNGTVILRDLTVNSRPISGTTGEQLTIINSRIQGVIR